MGFEETGFSDCFVIPGRITSRLSFKAFIVYHSAGDTV